MKRHTGRGARSDTRAHSTQGSNILEHAKEVVFRQGWAKRWPATTAPNSIDTRLVSADTTFFLLDQRNMERAAPAEINLPVDVQRRLEKTQQMAAASMMMGKHLIPKKPTSDSSKRSGNEARMMRIAASMATAGSTSEEDRSAERRRRAAKKVSSAGGLQNRFASRRSYIPMAQETPAMREIRIERHRKKQFSNRHKRHEQSILKAIRKRRASSNNKIFDQMHLKSRIRRGLKGEIQGAQMTFMTQNDPSVVWQNDVLKKLLAKVSKSTKFFVDENIARSVMTEVDRHEMGSLRRGFDLNPEGLSLAQFIELMLGFVPISADEEAEEQARHHHHHHHIHHKHTHHHTAEPTEHVVGRTRLQLTRNLCELFEQIDINGDGTLQWDEFTSYCVSQGLANDMRSEQSVQTYRVIRTHMGYNQDIGAIESMTSFVLRGNEWDPKMAKFHEMKQRHDNARRQRRNQQNRRKPRSTDDVLNEQGPILITCDRNAIHNGTWSIRDARTGKLMKRCGEGVHQAAVLAVTYVPCMEYIVTSSADLTLGFWDSRRHDLRQLMPVETEVCALQWVSSEDAGLRQTDSDTSDNTPATRETIFGESPDKKSGDHRRKASVLNKINRGVRVGTLYAGDVSGKIIGWDVAEMYTAARLEGHTDSVTSFLSIPSLCLLVSSSMDTTVRLWNLRSNIPLKVLRGHFHGVSSVAFSKMQRVLVSCGYDHEINVWNPYVETRTSGKLRGHSCAVLSVCCVDGTYEAVSVDIEGNLRVWDLRTLVCVQTIASHEADASGVNHKYDHFHNPNVSNANMFKDRKKVKTKEGLSVNKSARSGGCLSWCYVHHPYGNRIFVSMDQNLRVYAYDEVEDPKVADALTTTVVLYNPLTASFLTGGGRDCKTWDARSGKLLKEFANIIEDPKLEITAMCFDDQFRQFIVGDTGGRIRMHQCSNGQMLRELCSHSSPLSQVSEVVDILFNQSTDCIYSCNARGELIVQEDDGEGAPEEDNGEADAAFIEAKRNENTLKQDATGSEDNTKKTKGRQAGELYRRRRADLIQIFTHQEAIPSETTCLVHAPGLGLLAWGATDGDVVILDCNTGNAEGMCVCPTALEPAKLKLLPANKQAELRIPVTAMAFLEPYPVLAVADASGAIQLWTVRPFYIRQCPIMRFYNYKDLKVHRSSALAASAPWIKSNNAARILPQKNRETVGIIKLIWDYSTKRLIAGDECGNMLTWNMRWALQKLRLFGFSQKIFGDAEDGGTLGGAQKLGDILHPDLKREKLSPREILEESLAKTPREFTKRGVDESEILSTQENADDEAALAGLSWLGKLKRKQQPNQNNKVKEATEASQRTTRSASVSVAKNNQASRGLKEPEHRRSTLHDVKVPLMNEDATMDEKAKPRFDKTSTIGTHEILDTMLKPTKDEKSEDSGGVASESARSTRRVHTVTTEASRRTKAFRNYASLSRKKSRLKFGSVLSSDAAQLVDARHVHHEGICDMHILNGVRAVVSSGHDQAVVVSSLDVLWGNLEESDSESDEDVSNDKRILGRLWQGASDRDWALGHLIDEQIEKTLNYELDRAGKILDYMDQRAQNMSRVSGRHGQRGASSLKSRPVPSAPIRQASLHLMLKKPPKKEKGTEKSVNKKPNSENSTAIKKSVSFQDRDVSSISSCSSSDSESESSTSSEDSDAEGSDLDAALGNEEDMMGGAEVDRTERYLNALRKPGSSEVVSRRSSQRTAGITSSEIKRLVMNDGVRPPQERRARFHRASLRLRRTKHAISLQEAQAEKERQKTMYKKQIKDYEDIRKEQELLKTKRGQSGTLRDAKEDISDEQLLQDYVKKKERGRRITIKGGVATFEKIAETMKGPSKEEMKEQVRRKSLAVARRASLAGKSRGRAERSEENLKAAQGEYATLW